MNTTVIASRHGATLYVLPAAGPRLEVDAVREVLAAHGLALVEGSDLPTAAEFIAADGLDVQAASALAEDLRRIGLTVRVVNRGGLTGSQRVATALMTQVMAATGGLMATAVGWKALKQAMEAGASSPWPWVPIVLGVIVMALTLFNAITLQRQGGSAMRVAGTRRVGGAPLALTEQLAELEEALPAEVAAPILARARRLEAHAREHPDGAAAAELKALVAELRGHADEQVAAEAQALREDVARARRAMQETRRR